MHPSPTRKMYSRSNHVIWTPANAVSPPSLTGIRGKVQLSLKERLRGNAKLLKDQHKYGRFIDRILLKHAQEQNLPVISDSLTKKKHYKSCRIIKTEQPDTNSPTSRYSKELKNVPIEEQVEYRKSQKRRVEEREKQAGRGSKTDRSKSERVKSGEKEKQSLELPLIFKYKGSSTQERERTEHEDVELSRVVRLKELKQSIILKYIRQQ